MAQRWDSERRSLQGQVVHLSTEVSELSRTLEAYKRTLNDSHRLLKLGARR